MKKLSSLVLVLALLVVPVLGLAQGPVGGVGGPVTVSSNPCTPSAYVKGQDNSQLLGQCISQIYLYSLGAAGLLALLMIVLGGYYIMSAQGNAERTTKGREFVLSSIVGILILAGAFLILYTINPDLTDFSMKSLNCLSPSGNQAPIQPGQANPCP